MTYLYFSNKPVFEVFERPILHENFLVRARTSSFVRRAARAPSFVYEYRPWPRILEPDKTCKNKLKFTEKE